MQFSSGSRLRLPAALLFLTSFELSGCGDARDRAEQSSSSDGEAPNQSEQDTQTDNTRPDEQPSPEKPSHQTAGPNEDDPWEKLDSGTPFVQPEESCGTCFCDVWTQDCPDGEKCVPDWDFCDDPEENGDGESGENETGSETRTTVEDRFELPDEESTPTYLCKPVLGTKEIGEACTKSGDYGTDDDCDETSMCIGGVCYSFCHGSENQPACPEASRCGQEIWPDRQGLNELCFFECNPISAPCPAQHRCNDIKLTSGDWQRICMPIEDAKQNGESCEDENQCAAGLTCVGSDLRSDCKLEEGAMNDRCCTPWCNLNDPEACSDLGLACIPKPDQEYGDDPTESLGVCGLVSME